MMRSGNPALRGNVFSDVSAASSGLTMTVQGTVNKTAVLLLLAVISAGWIWGNPVAPSPLIVPAAIFGFITALYTVFRKQHAAVTAPIYAVLEGIVIGGISAIFERTYPGIVLQAVALTFGTLFALLMVYKSRLIKVTENFKLGVAAATGGIAIIYLVSFVVSLFGGNLPFIHESGPIGIAFSLFVVAIAAFNLVLDFDFIESGESAGAPKYMEWYGAFGLVVTLIWLYLEMLRLLSKMRRR